MNKSTKICLVPRLSGIGGMVSFQKKLEVGLKERNIEVCYDLGKTDFDAVLVIGGTRQLYRLWRVKQKGIPVIQRLDGMNWIHRVLNTGIRHRMRAEYGNIILTAIRSQLADKIAYQSEFSRKWWEREKGVNSLQFKVIHNAVDLGEFSPGNNKHLVDGTVRILLVEGSLLGGYEFGLENGVKLVLLLAHSHLDNRKIELIVIGKVSSSVQTRWEEHVDRELSTDKLTIRWVGTVAHEQIAHFYQSADIFFSADINAACPNSVIESLACGTPVLAFDTGALAELVGSQGGMIVPYGGDPWKLEVPDIQALSKGAIELLRSIDSYRISSRKRAEAAFNLDSMVDNYLELLLG